MPASELDWTSYNQGPIHQVFGTKRKADVGDKTVHECQVQDPSQQNAKRMCQWSDKSHEIGAAQQQMASVPAQSHGPVAFSEADNFCNNNNNNSILVRPGVMPNFGNYCASMETSHQDHSCDAEMQQEMQYRQIVHPALSHVLSQQPPRVPSPWPSHQPCQPNQMDNNIMDMNGETYNPAAGGAAAEMDQACSSMDSDFVPDQQQYTRANPNRESPNNTASSDFCRNFCGVGENSPTSGRVRCYCKPSWEGMLDMKPYVSDVY